MAELMSTQPRWDDAAYQRFADARGDGYLLDVRFENGDEIRVDLRALLNAEGVRVRWETLAVDPFELRVVVNDEEVEVPWLDVRALADEQLAAHLAKRADDHARHVGHRVRFLRERRRLTSRQLAERAGISAQSLSRIERGRHDVVFSTLRRLLAAMNFELADLAAIDDVGIDPAEVRARLVASGLAADTVERVLHGADDAPRVLARMRRIFGWSATDLAGPGLPPLLASPALAGRFNVPQRPMSSTPTRSGCLPSKPPSGRPITHRLTIRRCLPRRSRIATATCASLHLLDSAGTTASWLSLSSTAGSFMAPAG
jgi:transcriptional regulator with XRE-family HTH domain